MQVQTSRQMLSAGSALLGSMRVKACANYALATAFPLMAYRVRVILDILVLVASPALLVRQASTKA